MIRLLRFVFIVILFHSSVLFAQDSCHLRISLLTCSPGEELYSAFGHSAIRVVDSVHHDDIVFNYGTFDFDDPSFYTKFIRGKLLYYLSTDDFKNFREGYFLDKRSITEQVLNLSCRERQRMYGLLRLNQQGDNKFYKYDFLFDNCTTRLRDLLERSADTTVHFAKVIKEKTTFRDLIYVYLDYNDKQWSKLGIDILLGSKPDRVMTDREVMFLPDYLLKSFDSSKIGDKPVVSEKVNVIAFPNNGEQKLFITHPAFIFGIILLLIIVLSFSTNQKVQRYLIGFDSFMFFLLGVFGFLILFMWFGTDHEMCKNNYNLLWAIPSHAVFAFFMNRGVKWVSNYFKFTAVVYSVLLLLWFFLPQHFDAALLPIVIMMLFRSGMRAYMRK